LRQFPQLHTNPVNVLVAGKPIRASRESALWALACVDQLWRVRFGRIAPGERADAEKAYEEARALYRRIAAASATDGSNVASASLTEAERRRRAELPDK
jgi:hypothetical protein